MTFNCHRGTLLIFSRYLNILICKISVTIAWKYLSFQRWTKWFHGKTTKSDRICTRVKIILSQSLVLEWSKCMFWVHLWRKRSFIGTNDDNAGWVECRHTKRNNLDHKCYSRSLGTLQRSAISNWRIGSNFVQTLFNSFKHGRTENLYRESSKHLRKVISKLNW